VGRRRVRSGSQARAGGGLVPEIPKTRLKICATRFVKRGITICDLICWIVAWSPASYANELGVFDFALVALPN
jgi:hypothetical protein